MNLLTCDEMMSFEVSERSEEEFFRINRISIGVALPSDSCRLIPAVCRLPSAVSIGLQYVQVGRLIECD